jgi:Lon protease-like protein
MNATTRPNLDLEDALTRARRAEAKTQRLEARIEELERLINAPVVDDFLQALPIEAAHQQERWGTDHDAGKSPEEWLWLVAYLCTKATQAARYGDVEKHRHHVITAGAALLNWHRHATGELTAMRPGVDPAKVGA